MPRRSNIAWESIQIDYRLGQKSIKAIAKEHGVADSNLRRRAKQEGWQRDCADSIQIARERAVDEAVKAQASAIGAEIGAEQARLIRDGVEEAVLDGTTVILEHKRDARRGMQIARRLLFDIEEIVNAAPVLLQHVKELAKTDAEKAALLERALGLKGLAEALDRVAAASSKFHAIERQAHGLDKEVHSKASDLDEVLKVVHAERMKKLRESEEPPQL